MILDVNVQDKYQVIIENGILKKASSYFNLDRKVLILSDSGVPIVYSEAIKQQCKEAVTFVIDQGEQSKNIDSYLQVMKVLVENEFTRSDCIVAVGGGVVGDLGGFVASTYMRGIDFYNCPTTLLSQVDSSIGGKTAVDFLTYKNIIGAFYQPKCVLIDTSTLKTLSARQFYSGLVEALKMGITSDPKLVDLIDNNKGHLFKVIDEVIFRALSVKKEVVEKDTKEQGLRQILNFGHTIGHAIESSSDMKLLHGECVGLGMLYFSSKEVKQRIISILKKYNLPTEIELDKEEIFKYIKHDKKTRGNTINVVFVDQIGKYRIENISLDSLKEILVNENLNA